MVKFFRGFLILSLSTVFFCALAYANRGHEEWGRGDHEKSFDLEEKFFWKAHFYLEKADELGLTEEQTQKIKALKTETKKELIRRDADIEIAALDFKEALDEPQINVESVNSLVDQKYEATKAKIKYLVQAFANLKGALTPEQETKVKDLWRAKKEEKKA